MTIRDRISLTWRFGKGAFLIGAVYNLMCAGLQTSGFSYTFMVDSFILKGVLLPITLYLVKQFRDRDASLQSRHRADSSWIFMDIVIIQ